MMMKALHIGRGGVPTLHMSSAASSKSTWRRRVAPKINVLGASGAALLKEEVVSAPDETASVYGSNQARSLDVTLDTPVVPRAINPLLVGMSFTLLVLLTIATVARIPKLLQGMLGAVTGVSGNVNVGSLFGDFRYRCRLALGSFQAWADNIVVSWERTWGPPQTLLSTSEWSVCTLAERTKVGSSCMMYRFRLQGPNCVLPLQLGQEVTLCSLNRQNQVMNGSFYPLSPRDSAGHFEIVTGREHQDEGGEGFADLLGLLAIGDEVAVRPGMQRLVYQGPYTPITDVLMVASGLGIVPMLQMVRELLPSRESSVDTASVVWLNEHAEDFALYDLLETAFYKFHRKLDVSCIIERDLFGHQLASNEKVREAIPEFKIGALAVVSGPDDYFKAKVEAYLERHGWPREVIVTL